MKKPRYNETSLHNYGEHILTVPWLFVKSMFHCMNNSLNKKNCQAKKASKSPPLSFLFPRYFPWLISQ